jgi:membrane-associated protein
MADETLRPMPWSGQARRADKVLLGWLSFAGLYQLALLPLVPALIATHPLLLAVVRGSSTAIVTLGALARTGDGSIVVAILAGLPATVMFDWVFWWAGRRWGVPALALFLGNKAKATQRAERVQRLTKRYGVSLVLFSYLILPIPNPLIYAAAGLGGMRLRVFLICNILSGLSWTALLAGLGYAIGQSAVDVVEGISTYALWITVGLVLFVILRQFAGGMRRPRA